ncbi:MAG: LysE family translocator [Rhodospirillales bacterium]|nr:LysE family translocator [Rhodospirillales bacterium]
MSIETIIALFIASFIIKATPGPGVFATVGRALFQGLKPALVFIAGIMTGDLLYLAFAFTGLAVIAHQFGEFFFIVRLIGGGYLIYLGIKLWRTTPGALDTRPIETGSRTKTFLSGLLLTAGNPKVILFYLGLLPTFVDLTQLSLNDMGLLTAMFLGILGSTLTAYAFAASRARRLFSSKSAMRRLNRGTGVVLIGSGGAVVAS